MVRAALIRLLRLQGHQVRTANSGEEALEQLRAEECDVMLSDLKMGTGMDGYGLAGQVRRRWPRMPFILASGSVGLDPAAARAQGVDAVLAKPYRPEELRHLLAQLTEPKNRAAQQLEAA